MAFYGRVTNESKTSMTFDRIYPNRATMDAHAADDGVFTGRFVLVEYGTETEEYSANYQIDKAEHQNLGRGYDSTVWRKVVVDGEAKYVLLAELNSVVPTFDVAADHPTSEPVAPHFGADKSNVYYPLHTQSTWGFRIAKAENANQSDFTVKAKDYSAYDYVDNTLMPRNVPGYNDTDYKAAIYFNKAGFNKNESHPSNIALKDNKITLEPVASGQLYETHDADHTKAEAPDTQELKIILPALGDAVSDMYDKVYSTKRSFDTQWQDPNHWSDKQRENSLSLVKGGAGSELEYEPKEAESLVGTINAVHDALGMIITEDKRPEEAKDAYSNQIYYDAEDGKFYCTVPTLDYEIIDFEDGDFSLTPQEFANKYQDDIEQFTGLSKYDDEQYFIKTDDTPTYLQTSRVIAGEKYYRIPKHLKFAGNMVDSAGDSQYYIQNSDGNYVHDANGKIDIKEYYKITSGSEEFSVNKNYYTYNAIYHSFTADTSVTADNFNDKVNAGLYTDGQLQKYIINHGGNTLYNVRYNVNGRNNMIQVASLNGGNSAYTVALGSKNDFIQFLRTYLPVADPVISDPNTIVDYTHLYIPTGIVQEGDKYVIRYDSTPLDNIMFNDWNQTTGYYNNLYQKKNGNEYYRINTINEFNVEGTEYTFYRIMPITITEYESNKYWYVEAPASEMAQLRTARDNNTLNTVETSRYNIFKLVKSVDGFVGDRIYWSFLDQNDTDYTEGQEDVKLVGYGIDDKYNELEEDNNVIKYYVPNILYYKDEHDRYILADDSYIFNEAENVVNNKPLYRIHELFIVEPGASSLKRYSRWDNNLIQSTADISTYFKDVENGGYGIKIGWKENDAEWKELEGFAKDLNTIHGWIIRLNRLLNTDDIKTRDTNTLQGCINTLNDLIAKFDELPPGEVLGINKFGNIEAIELLGDKWIDVTKTFTSTGSPKLTISYQGEVSQTANKNVVTNVALDNNTGKINITRKNLSEITLGTAIGNNAPGIETTDTLGQALTKITNHYDNGATNIILSEYNNYSTMPYVITEDTSPQSGKTYYIKNGDAFIEYTSNPWENGITVYEKIENAIIDNNDNINEAIAKLQYQINDHKENQLHISGSGNVIGNLTVENGEITATKRNIGALAITGFTADNTATADLAAADTLNAALNKLQAKIKALTTTVDGNDNADNVQNFEAIGAGDYITSLTLGTDKKLSATTANLNSAINSNVLTNYTEADIGGSNIATSDTLLTALAKLQIQINNITGGAAGATWTAAAPTGTIKSVTAANVVDGDTVATAVNKLQAQIANGWNLAAPNGTITTVSGTVANGDTIATAINKLQTQISSTLTSTQIDDTYAKIFRQETAPTGTLKSGWIWIQTSTKYIYFYTGQAWELLNSWQ